MPTFQFRGGQAGAAVTTGLVDADRLSRSTTAMFAASLVMLLVAGLAAALIAVRAGDVELKVAQTIEVNQAARVLLHALQSAETNQRGYLLSNDEGFLPPYEKAAAKLPVAWSRLDELVNQDPGHQFRMDELLSLVEQRIQGLREGIELTRRGDVVAARDRDRLKVGQELTERVRTHLNNLSQAELQQLSEFQARAALLRWWLIALVALSLAATIALSLLVGRALQHYIGRLRVRACELEGEIKRRRETEETLRQSQKMEAVGQLTGGVAHDFNNLLTIIIGNLDTVRRRLLNSTAVQDAGHLAATISKPVDLAIQGSRSAAQLTQRLLAFSRRQALEPANVDVNDLIARTSDLLHRTLGENICVETVLAGGLWPTFADANQIENVLLNLAVNARDAMPDGGRLTIETANSYLDEAYTSRFGDVAPGQYVLLSVTDTGTGIPPEVLERVFEPFFTTKEPGLGSGLGLAMVHGFVKQSHGHVRIYSEDGQGTTVKVYLPRSMAVENVPANPAGVDPAEESLSRARPNETLLVVEDNAGVREYAVSVLEDLGYRIIEAADAREAMEALETAPPISLLFTDVVLPGQLSGRDLAVKVQERYPGLPVLFTTGYTRNAIVHNGRLDAKVHLLNKPYTQQELARKLRELLDAAEIRRSATAME
ncbi:MAG: CHASE3 domain-containing protein [Hyphomicrobiaceae bacterium]|nr:CHASE3 domain-containing protein [Hyphomicrobiaceae bacterium]